MSNELEVRYQEAVILTRITENIFRKLSKFLIGRITLVKLQEILKLVFVEEVENKLQHENPSKNVSLTQIGVLTGLDTRTLTKIRNSKNYRQPLHQESSFLEEFTPGASILDAWCSEDAYTEKSTGKPKPLDMTGKISFETLFKKTIKSRGITYKSLLKTLVQSKSVSIEDNKVRLISNSYLPSRTDDNLGTIQMGFSAVANLLDTVIRNINAGQTGAKRFYQRGAWTYRLNHENKSKLREELGSLLKRTDIEARSIIKRHEDKRIRPDKTTAGISLFYFEETNQK